MRYKRKILENKYITKKCAFCNANFYAKRNSAKYCSDSCKAQYNKEKRKTQNWYYENPNKGKRLPLGTVTSWEMAEDKLVFSGDLTSLYWELPKYMSQEQLSKEKEYIENRKPFSETHEWFESANQIFTNENFKEVFRILQKYINFISGPGRM